MMRAGLLSLVLGLTLATAVSGQTTTSRFHWQPQHVLTYRVEQVTSAAEKTGGGKVDLSGSSAMYIDVYAPGSKVTLIGSAQIFGGIVGKSIILSGSTAIHRDMNLPGGVALVK